MQKEGCSPYYRHFDYDGMGTNFFKTSVEVKRVIDGYAVYLSPAYTDRNWRQFANHFGLQETLSNAEASLSFSRAKNGLFNIDFMAVCEVLGVHNPEVEEREERRDNVTTSWREEVPKLGEKLTRGGPDISWGLARNGDISKLILEHNEQLYSISVSVDNFDSFYSGLTFESDDFDLDVTWDARMKERTVIFKPRSDKKRGDLELIFTVEAIPKEYKKLTTIPVVGDKVNELRRVRDSIIDRLINDYPTAVLQASHIPMYRVRDWTTRYYTWNNINK